MEVPNLRSVRENAFLTQAELAVRSGVSEITISRLETGRHKARISTVRKLAKALAVEPGELISAVLSNVEAPKDA